MMRTTFAQEDNGSLNPSATFTTIKTNKQTPRPKERYVRFEELGFGVYLFVWVISFSVAFSPANPQRTEM